MSRSSIFSREQSTGPDCWVRLILALYLVLFKMNGEMQSSFSSQQSKWDSIAEKYRSGNQLIWKR
jgi:hypothetical protein